MRAIFAMAAVASVAVCTPLDSCANSPLDPVGKARSGSDYLSYNSSSLTAEDCMELCCEDSNCWAISYNNPQPGDYMTCKTGGVCCLLKDTTPPLEPSKWGPNVRTGVPQKPPVPPPTPSDLQERFMTMGFTQFMHFSVTTFGNEEHDCYKGKCLPASDFNPTDVDTDQWVRTAVAGGAGEICLTAHHEGGFALWPTQNDYNYTVAYSPWKKDILASFVESCKKYGVRICYYLSPSANGYLTQVAKTPAAEFVKLQLDMTEEVLTKYGPVSRLWWDHYGSSCGGLSNCPDGSFPAAWPNFTALVRRVSPDTILGTGPDVQHSYGGESGVGSYPIWNTCNVSSEDTSKHCDSFDLWGNFFKPREADATIQNPGDAWFWHAGHAFWNSSQIWDHYFLTWGRGDAFILNMPPNTTGVIPQEYVDSMAGFGQANKASFGTPVVAASSSQLEEGLACDGVSPTSVIELDLPSPYAGAVNSARLEEDMQSNGQRILNYTIEGYNSTAGSWSPLPFVHGASVGYRIVDFFDGSGPDAVEFSDGGWEYLGAQRAGTHGHRGEPAQRPQAPETSPLGGFSKIRFRCLAARTEPAHLKWFGLYSASRP